ncbi:type II toxin-antitoxin system Phd/YefM family antitoxin [Rhizobium leguminosarum]|jgi:PHD/YefM family antitoxin component YafN of YafNO toxin-antitoxin module|uniref:Antitoxin n=2 Tax=Rhizobium leguminosarum TaxID=384 RepID=A0A3S3W8E2_RHILE|nr:type II toxin-antitoxin system Phd/YefM family antitoxin [Rhizobium leguminosarum]NEI39590.1 type II toxin-antitoxin system Phd/YefM family antitoxin [Rhizobium leguminosarum]QKK34353.1 type II toxin-antitoxin system Phd/YefM family antitoxin [Rhizobium indicum]QND18389.1 type II toxin-antitoxin system Phd/YefM family antitoxin [Rhizobium leguminosarum bv. trifolii]RWY80752.1 type II toxin-antitoxin system Phd/YefM family antitoxin [Rhizobium leguminosarum]
MVSMKMSFMTSAAFNQNPSKAKKEASEQPLVITDHGEAAYVLVSYAEFQANWKAPKTLFAALRDPGADEREFEPERLDFDNRTVEF